MSIVEHAVVAAAGLGSRLGHGRPKCLVEVDGETILSHLMRTLRDVPDVRVVVGFMEMDVIAELSRVRPDALVVRNPAFRTTTTLHSYALGARGLHGDCLFMDADLLIENGSFQAFLEQCRAGEPRLALTPAHTTDAVYAITDGAQVTGFSRNAPTAHEWSNISWLPVDWFSDCGPLTVYQHLRFHLPIAAGMLESYEIDTSEDLERAMAQAERLGIGLGRCLRAAA